MFKSLFSSTVAWSAKIFFLCLSLSAAVSGSGQEYLWPTDASRALTSSFGEFRPRHYHAAIDIKTWNRTGYRIFAIEDGYIMRARISAFGYGKAIYLKLKDGNIVIYAHLQNFFPELEAFLNRIRLERESYEIDHHFTSGQFPVKKGQVLGHTGQSGIGYPHLHFEIRNSRNMPVNPLQYYPSIIKDNIPPRMYEAALFPWDDQSTLNMKTDTLTYPLQGSGISTIPDTLLLSGKTALALKVYDQADGVPNRFSFYNARMWIDDSLVYSVQYDIFSYALSYKIELDKNFSLWRKGEGIFHNFYRHRLNNLPHYSSIPPGGGIIDSDQLKEGLHTLRINITDFAGNESEFKMVFWSGSIPKLQYDLFRWLEDDLYLRIQSDEKLDSILVLAEANPGGWKPENIDRSVAGPPLNDSYQYTFSLSPEGMDKFRWLKIIGLKSSGIPSFPLFVAQSTQETGNAADQLVELMSMRMKKNWFEFIFRLNYPEPIRILKRLNDEIPDIFWFPLEKNIFQINWPLNAAFSQQLVLEKLFGLNLKQYALVSRRSKTVITSDDGLFRAEFPPNSLYDDIGVSLHETMDSTGLAAISSPYSRIGKVYELEPFDQPVDAGIWVSLSLPPYSADIRGAGLYYLDRKGWTFISASEANNANIFSSRVTSMEKFTLIQDTIPPLILPVHRIQNNILPVRNGVVRFMIKDEMSGIGDESRISFYIDGMWQLFEFDPEEDTISLPVPETIQRPASLLIRVEDNCGNTVIKEYQIQ